MQNKKVTIGSICLFLQRKLHNITRDAPRALLLPLWMSKTPVVIEQILPQWPNSWSLCQQCFCWKATLTSESFACDSEPVFRCHVRGLKEDDDVKLIRSLKWTENRPVCSAVRISCECALLQLCVFPLLTAGCFTPKLRWAFSWASSVFLHQLLGLWSMLVMSLIVLFSVALFDQFLWQMLVMGLLLLPPGGLFHQLPWQMLVSSVWSYSFHVLSSSASMALVMGLKLLLFSTGLTFRHQIKPQFHWKRTHCSRHTPARCYI